MDEEAVNRLPSIDYIGLVRVRRGKEVVALIPNLPGKQKSLRIYNGLTHADSFMDRNAKAEALRIFGDDLIQQTRQSPAKHPNIALLLNTPEDVLLQVERVCVQHPGLFERLVAGTATADDKTEGMMLLEKGAIRTAEKVNGVWSPQMYGIEAMNGVFTRQGLVMMEGGYYDKVPLLTTGWDEERFKAAGVRFIPGCWARRGAYIGSGTTLMPHSIVNTGAYIAGDNVMIDGGARVATGAQVGKGVKLGAGSGMEGILEPKGMLPTILEDGVRVGANCEIKGLVEEGSIIATGVQMASGVKIYDEREGRFIEPLYVQVGDKTLPMPNIPKDRIAVPGAYFLDRNQTVGGICIRLLEKPASESSFGQASKNVSLYVKA